MKTIETINEMVSELTKQIEFLRNALEITNHPNNEIRFALEISEKLEKRRSLIALKDLLEGK